MGAEITDAKPLDAPALKPLKLANRLAGRPERPPTYGTTIQSSDGQEVVLGDPRATRFGGAHECSCPSTEELPATGEGPPLWPKSCPRPMV